jgi:hypothetical protein
MILNKKLSENSYMSQNKCMFCKLLAMQVLHGMTSNSEQLNIE